MAGPGNKNFDDIIKQAMDVYANNPLYQEPRSPLAGAIQDWLRRFDSPQMDEGDMPPDTANNIQRSGRDQMLSIIPYLTDEKPPYMPNLRITPEVDLGGSPKSDQNI